MFKRNFPFFFAFALIFCSSCARHYAIVKSNRTEHNINASIVADSSIIKTYLPYKTEVDAEMNKIIGYTEVDLTKDSKLTESLIGNFFADAVFNQVKKIEPSIDMVIPTTKGGIRIDIAKGPVRISNIFEMMPFENQLILFTLKGEDMMKLLKFIASTNGQPVAGLKMEIKDNSPTNILIGGKPFDILKSYRIVTSDYISSGGDDATGFANPISTKVIGLKVRDALLKEVIEIEAQGKKINTTLDGRITKN